MKAWVLPRQGSIDGIELTQLPDPEPGPDEVVLRLGHAALNPADRYLAEGLYQPVEKVLRDFFQE
jgi:NADPH:quinone reductase-like Zn-dependent oxidoreductase